MPSCMDFLPIANTAVHDLRRLQEEARATTEDSHWHARRLSELPCRRCGATWFLQLLLSTLTHPDPDWYLIQDNYLGRFSTVVYDECMTSSLIAHAFQPPSSRSLSSDARMLSRRTVWMCNYLQVACRLHIGRMLTNSPVHAEVIRYASVAPQPLATCRTLTRMATTV